MPRFTECWFKSTFIHQQSLVLADIKFCDCSWDQSWVELLWGPTASFSYLPSLKSLWLEKIIPCFIFKDRVPFSFFHSFFSLFFFFWLTYRTKMLGSRSPYANSQMAFRNDFFFLLLESLSNGLYFSIQDKKKSILNRHQCHMVPNDFFRYSNQCGLVIAMNERQILIWGFSWTCFLEDFI